MLDMRTIKVMADYFASPLWIEGDGVASRNVNPSTLGISESLATELMAWADEYTGTLNSDDPSASGFADVATELAFVAKGRELADRLQAELRQSTRVDFFHFGRAGRFDGRK